MVKRILLSVTRKRKSNIMLVLTLSCLFCLLYAAESAAAFK